jgi:phosphoribosylaminoimidazole carboxylase (NCAIR synthetase)
MNIISTTDRDQDLQEFQDVHDLEDIVEQVLLFADEISLGPARCADGNGTLTPLFFSDHVVDIARAKAICAKCALRERCLDDALQRQEPWGVWGGELLSGGRIVAVKRPCGRPPKHPRPELVVDEMGVVVEVA